MKSERTIKIVALIALFVSIIGLTIGYAAFSSSLKISGLVTAKSSSDSWNVHFEPKIGATLTPTLSGKASVGTPATLSATQISGFNINFYAPGDTVEYDFKVVNSGILDAELTSVALGTLTCTPVANGEATQQEATSLCEDLTLSLKYFDGSNISATDTSKTLLKSESKDLKLVVSWKQDSTLQVSDDINVNIGESTFVYTQK